MSSITFQGETIELTGSFPQVGQKVADFSLIGADLSEVKLSDFAGKTVLLNIFPSIDTPVCANSVRRFNKELADKDVVVLCISADLPFAAGRFCVVEGIENVKTASFFRCENFSINYGVALTGALTGFCARAVIILNEAGEVTYSELVSEMTNDPNFDAALEALKKA